MKKQIRYELSRAWTWWGLVTSLGIPAPSIFVFHHPHHPPYVCCLMAACGSLHPLTPSLSFRKEWAGRVSEGVTPVVGGLNLLTHVQQTAACLWPEGNHIAYPGCQAAAGGENFWWCSLLPGTKGGIASKDWLGQRKCSSKNYIRNWTELTLPVNS